MLMTQVRTLNHVFGSSRSRQQAKVKFVFLLDFCNDFCNDNDTRLILNNWKEYIEENDALH